MPGSVTRRAVAGGLAALPLAPFALAAPFALSHAARAAPVFAGDHAVSFAVAAPDAPPGRHSIALTRADGRLTVRIESLMHLPQADAPPLAFRHFAEETWEGGWLTGLVADTRFGPPDAPRREHRVRAQRIGDALRGTRDGARFSISGYLLTAAGWHRDTPRAEGLVDAVDGKVKRTSGRSRGLDTVETGWGPTPATRWSLTGEIRRELWYDEAGRLVRFALPAPGGAVVATAVEIAG